MPSKDRRLYKEEYAVRRIKNPSVMSLIYAPNVYDKNYAFLAYYGLAKKIFLEEHKSKGLKDKELETIFWIHSRPQGFTITDFLEYPNGYKSVSSNKFIKRLMSWNFVEIRAKRSGGKNPKPNVYACTSSFNSSMQKYYQWMFLKTAIPMNRHTLGDLFDDIYVKRFVNQQHLDVKWSKETFGVFEAKKR